MRGGCLSTKNKDTTTNKIISCYIFVIYCLIVWPIVTRSTTSGSLFDLVIAWYLLCALPAFEV